MPALLPLALFQNLGVVEIAIILFVVLLLFGARLPGAARSLGRSLVEFKKGLRDADEGPRGPASGGGTGGER